MQEEKRMTEEEYERVRQKMLEQQAFIEMMMQDKHPEGFTYNKVVVSIDDDND